jgi:hypothetical protein
MSSKKSEPCGGTTVPSFSPLPEGKDMAGGGRGGHVVFPHPDDEEARRLLNDVGMGSTNMNDDDNNDTPPPPPKNDNRVLTENDQIRRQPSFLAFLWRRPSFSAIL